MRPLKYPNLGEMEIQRVTNRAARILPKLQECMEIIEKNGGDSLDVLRDTFDSIIEREQYS